MEDLLWESFDREPARSFQNEEIVIAHFEQFIFPVLGKLKPGSVSAEQWFDAMLDAHCSDRGIVPSLFRSVSGALGLAAREKWICKNVLVGKDIAELEYHFKKRFEQDDDLRMAFEERERQRRATQYQDWLNRSRLK